MAVNRTPPQCLKCGKDIKAIYQDQSNLPPAMQLIGDTFIGWDWDAHKCEENCINPSVSFSSFALENNSIEMSVDEFQTLEKLLEKLRALLGKHYAIIPQYIADGYCIGTYKQNGAIDKQEIGATIEAVCRKLLANEKQKN